MPTQTALTIIGPSSDGKTFTGTAPPGALIRISTQGLLNFTDQVYADDRGLWSYAFPIAVFNLTASILSLAADVIFVPDPLTPSTASYAIATNQGDPIVTLGGLSPNETFVNIRPNDGRVVIDATGKILERGPTAPVAGSVTYNLVTSAGRVLQIVITVAGQGTQPAPVLNTLTLSAAVFTAGDVPGTTIGAIQGKTDGSTVTFTPNDGRVAVSGSNLVVGNAAATAGTIVGTLTETLNGATTVNSVVNITVNPAIVLAALSLSASKFTAGATAGTLIGNILGRTSGSTLTLSPNDPRVALSSDGLKLLVGSGTASSPDSLNLTLTETISGISRNSSVSVIIEAAPIVLSPLTLSAVSFPAGATPGTIIGTISGKTTGSTLAFTPNDGRVTVSGNNLIVGSAATSAGTISGTLTETLAGATNSPNATNLTITINAAAPVLNTLTLSNTAFTAGAAQNTIIGTISGKTSGSTLSLSPNDGRFTISGSNIVVGSVSSAAGTFAISLIETLAGATGSPKSTAFNLTANTAAPSLNILTLSNATFASGTASGTLIGNILGKTSGSTIALATNDNRFVIGGPNGDRLIAGPGAASASAGTANISLVETLSGAAGSPKTTPLSVTITAAGAPTLSALSLSGTTVTAGAAPGTVIGTISGQTSGSTLVFTPNDGRVTISGSNLITGNAALSAGTISGTITETLSGASGSPRATNVTLTVNAAVVNLNALTLSNAAFAATDPSGTLIGNIIGKTAGSTIAFAPNDNRVAVSSDSSQLVVGLSASTAGTISGTLTETLSGTSRVSNVTLTVNAAAPTLNTLTLSNSTFKSGAPSRTFIGGAQGKTSGSTLSFSPNDGRVSVSGSNLLVGATAASTGTISGTLTETVGTTTKTSNVVLTIAPADAPVLNALSVKPATFAEGAAAGTVIGTIVGKTAGSDLTLSPSDGRIVFNTTKTQLLVGLATTVAGTVNLSLTETLSAATGSPRTSIVPITISAAEAAVTTLAARVRQVPNDVAPAQVGSTAGVNYFKTANAVALSSADTTVPASCKAMTFGWVGGFRQLNMATQGMFRIGGGKLSIILAAGLRAQITLANASGGTAVSQLCRNYDYSQSDAGPPVIRKELFGHLSVGMLPNQFFGFGTDTTTNFAKMYKRNDGLNGGAIEDIGTTPTITANANLDVSTSGVIEILGVSGSPTRDMETDVLWGHLGLSIDWAATIADATSFPSRATPYKYWEILADKTLRGTDGEGVLKAAGAYASVADPANKKWAKPHYFMSGADGVTGTGSWGDPNGYNRGTSPKVIYTTNGTGEFLPGYAYPKLSAVPAGQTYEVSSSPGELRSARRIGQARDILRIEGGPGSDYSSKPTSEAMRQTRINEQAFSKIFSHYDVAEGTTIFSKIEDWRRTDPNTLPPGSKPSWMSNSGWQAGLDSKAWINEKPGAPGIPEYYDDQKFSRWKGNKHWFTVPANGLNGPTGNNEKGYYIPQGDIVKGDTIYPYKSALKVFDFQKTSDGVPYVDLLTTHRKKLAALGLVPADYGFLDETRQAIAATLCSFNWMEFNYGTVVIQLRRDMPADFPRHQSAGNFFSTWVVSQYGKFYVPYYGSYREVDIGEMLGRLFGASPMSLWSTVAGFPATNIVQDRICDYWFDPDVDGKWLEFACTVVPPWINGTAGPSICFELRRADETVFQLMVGTDRWNTYENGDAQGRAANPFSQKTEYARGGVNSNTVAQNPQVASFTQSILGSLQLNNAFEPNAFNNNWDDGSADYPMRNSVGAIGFFCPETWKKPVLTGVTTVDFRSSTKKHQRGLEYGLRLPSVVGTPGTLAANSVILRDFTVAMTATLSDGTTTTTLKRPFVLELTTNSSGAFDLSGFQQPVNQEGGTGWGADVSDVGKIVTVTMAGGVQIRGTIGSLYPDDDFPIVGTEGDDIIYGNSQPGFLHGGHGNDIIYPGPTPLTVEPTTSALDIRKAQNRVFTGPGYNRVIIDPNSLNWIYVGREYYTGDFTTVVIPANYKGTTHITAFFSRNWDVYSTEIRGDVVDLTGCGFTSREQILAAIVDDDDTTTEATCYLDLPSGGRVAWDGWDYGTIKKVNFTVDNFIIDGSTPVNPTPVAPTPTPVPTNRILSSNGDAIVTSNGDNVTNG